MRQRGVSEDQVASVIRGRHTRRNANRPGAIRLEATLSARRRLALIVEDEPAFVRVVSAFWV